MAKFLQWNLQSYRTKFYQLKQLLNEFSPACVCLQETLHGTTTLRPPSTYSIEQSAPVLDDNHERGTAILIHKTVRHDLIQLNTNLQAVAVRLHLEKTVTVCSLYLPHIPVTKQNLANLIQQLPAPFLLLGDMNAKSPLWGGDLTDVRGRIFEDLLRDLNVSILNDHTPTHYHVQTDSSSVIDLSICSSDILPELKYSVVNDLHDSDHYPICLETSGIFQSFDKPPRYNTSKADWPNFKESTKISEQQQQHHNFSDAETLSKFITDTIIHAANSFIPKTSGRLRRPPVPWWNSQCRDAARERLRAERAMKRNHTVENKIRYNRARAKCKYICNISRKESWIKYVSSLTKTLNLHEVWKKVKKIGGKFASNPHPSLLSRTNNEIITEHATVANMLASSFASVSGHHNYTPEFVRLKNVAEARPLNFNTVCNDQYNLPFTMTELNSTLSRTADTSPGIDLITYPMIKSIHPSLLSMILRLYNRLFERGEFPVTWKTAIVIAIPKPGKDHLDPANYRPISLICCLSKLMESMVNVRLMWYLEANSLITAQQSGFRKHRSTTDHLIDLETAVRVAMSRRQHTVAVFFDLKKAYDTAWRHGILKQLYDFGMRGCLPIFVRNFMHERSISVRVGNSCSASYDLLEGLPQGSPLSCTCFLIAINKIADNLPIAVRSTLFVDDYTIYASGTLPHLIERQLQLALNRLSVWSQSCGLSFSPSKTVAMHICRKQNCTKIVNTLTMNGTPLLTKENHKFLGLTFDNSLTWRPHITNLKKSCHKTLDLLKHLSYKKWGADRTTLLRLYIMLLKPKLDYGCEAYGSACRSLIDTLPPIQNAAIRIATGAYRSSPVMSLHAEAGLKPLEYYHHIKQLNYVANTLVAQSHPHLERNLIATDISEDEHELPKDKSFFTRIEAINTFYQIDFNNIMQETMSELPPWTYVPPAICKELWTTPKNSVSAAELRQEFLAHCGEHVDCTSIYTDGSRTDVGVGCAFVCGDVVQGKTLPVMASVYTAELTAIHDALLYARTLEPLPNTLVLHSDSRSSIQAIAQFYPKHPLVQKIQEILIRSKLNVTLCWVPSHVGIKDNDRADVEARLSCSSNEVIPPSLIPRTDFKALIKRTISDRWERQWRNVENNKLREIKPTVASLPDLSVVNRQWERILTRLRIGHTNVTHGHLMNGGTLPYCDDCLVPQTVKHIIVECPSHNEKRTRLFGKSNLTLQEVLIDGTLHLGPLWSFLSELQIISDI